MILQNVEKNILVILSVYNLTEIFSRTNLILNISEKYKLIIHEEKSN